MPNDIPEVKRDPVWRDRERIRQWDRTLPVWRNDPLWQQIVRCEDPRVEHYVHVSESDPKLLAYTQDNDKGERDIQTPIKPGKYLTKYFSKELTAKQIRYFTNWQLTGVRESAYDKAELHFADTQEGIVRVYRQGPHSCMVFRDRDVAYHPCRVYAAGDLSIAYLTHNSKIIARALVWPANKVVGRVYPTDGNWAGDGFSSIADSQDAKGVLTRRLRADGYDIDGSFNGAHLLKLEDGSRTVMPYLDGDYGVNDHGDGDRWVMTDECPDYCCGETSGLICTGDEEEEEEYDYTCEDCEEGINETYTYYRRITHAGSGRVEHNVCYSCRRENAFYCEGFGEWLSDGYNTAVTVDGTTYSETYAEVNFAQCDGSEVWFDPDTDAKIAVDVGGDDHVWCQSYFKDHGFTCLASGRNVPNDAVHPDHDGVWIDATKTEIAAYLALKPAPETIPDMPQITFTATWGDQTATLTY